MLKFHHCLFKILKKKQNVADKELQRAITELAPSPYFSIIINVNLVDINVFVKFDEIPSLPVQVIKENPKCHCNRGVVAGSKQEQTGTTVLNSLFI